MKVVALNNRRKQLTAVCFDDGREILLDTELLVIENIRVGSEICDLEEIIYKSDLKRAKSRALWYLSRSDHSEKALYDKLIRGGFSDKASSNAVLRMKELGLVNDEAYARRMAEYMSETTASNREICEKLQSRGINRDLIRQLELSNDGETDKIKRLLNTKYQNKLGDPEGVKKVFAALIRKGFSYSDVKSAMKEYSEEILYSEE